MTEQDLTTKVALLEQRLRTIEDRQKVLSSGINRGLWIIGGGFLASFVAFVTRGGLGA